MNALQAVIEQMMALSGVQLEGTATPDAAETPQSSVPTEETPPGKGVRIGRGMRLAGKKTEFRKRNSVSVLDRQRF